MSQKITINAIVNEPANVAFDKLYQVVRSLGYYIPAANPSLGTIDFQMGVNIASWTYVFSVQIKQINNQTELTFLCKRPASDEIDEQRCNQKVADILKSYNQYSKPIQPITQQTIAQNAVTISKGFDWKGLFKEWLIGMVILGIALVGFYVYMESRGSSSSYSSQSNSSSSSSGSNFSPNPGNKYSWLQGYWQCATPYGSMFLLIDGKGRISSKDEDGNIEAGSYTVDDENNELRVHFDKEPEWLITTYKLQNQQIYFGSGLWYYKFAPY